MAEGRAFSLAIVIPAYNAESTLGDCLAAIAASERTPDELILYDDGSTDATGAMARAAGAIVLRNDGDPGGPAVGRNAGVAIAKSDIVVFVDADVSIHPTALDRLEAAFTADANIAAAFGSYDDRPRSQKSAALYANLRHHFVHQGGGRSASTFWAGLGAMRRQVFLDIGGFDTRYSRPSIEDIELGVRLNQAGHGIALVPEALGTHCKDWGKRQLWRTDIMSRAVPWTQLIAAGKTQGADLNLVGRERMKAVLAHLVWVFALWALWRGSSKALALSVSCLFAYIVLNIDFLALLRRAGGWRTAAFGLGFHWLYHVYASLTFAYVIIKAKIVGSVPEPGVAPAKRPAPRLERPR